MRAFIALALGAVCACTQYAEAFSPASRSKVLANLQDLRMTGAGGAASPDANYVEGESGHLHTWNRGRRGGDMAI